MAGQKCLGHSRALLLGEVVRYIVIILPLYMATWRYADYKGYTEFTPGANCTPDASTGTHDQGCINQFWGVVTGIIVAATMVIYAPLKLVCSRTGLKYARYSYGWRPSILTYILTCALPCMVLILIAIQTSEKGKSLAGLDVPSMTTIQLTVLGLTITEWMAKVREESFSYDLMGAMATDFFFAYDVFDFFAILLHTTEVLHSNWLYAVFVLGWLSMFKYVPHPPTCTSKHVRCMKRAAICIVIGMLLNDIPFVIIRLGTMIEFGLDVSDLVHPAKNIAAIILDVIKLYILYNNAGSVPHGTSRQASQISERRVERDSLIPETEVIGSDDIGGQTSLRDLDDGSNSVVRNRVQPADNNGYD